MRRNTDTGSSWLVALRLSHSPRLQAMLNICADARLTLINLLNRYLAFINQRTQTPIYFNISKFYTSLSMLYVSPFCILIIITWQRQEWKDNVRSLVKQYRRLGLRVFKFWRRIAATLCLCLCPCLWVEGRTNY